MQINFNVKGKIITLEWSDGETFKKVIGRQTSFFGKTPNEMTDEFVKQKLREEYTGHIEYILDNVPLPDNPTILDIGSGTSIVDLSIYSYLDKKAKFYLLDGKNLIDGRGGHTNLHDKDFQPFNKWDPVLDAINTLGFNLEDFTFLDAAWEWDGSAFVPNTNITAQHQVSVDLVISIGAYGLHFPISNYWDLVMSTLKPGGWLVIRPMVNLGNQFEFICSQFGAPKYHDEVKMSLIKDARPNDFLRWEKLFPNANDPESIWGYCGIWQRPL